MKVSASDLMGCLLYIQTVWRFEERLSEKYAFSCEILRKFFAGLSYKFFADITGVHKQDFL